MSTREAFIVKVIVGDVKKGVPVAPEEGVTLREVLKRAGVNQPNFSMLDVLVKNEIVTDPERQIEEPCTINVQGKDTNG